MANKTNVKLSLDAGNDKTTTKTINNINPDATAENLATMANRLAGMQKKGLLGVKRVDTSDVTL